MLLRHSTFYLLARGLPGVVNFLAIAILTRLLSPGDYGQYALVMAGASLVVSTLFWWLVLGLERFVQAELDEPTVLMSNVALGYSVVALSTLALGFVAWLAFGTAKTQWFFLVGALLVCGRAWFDLNLAVAKARLQPMRYGVIAIIKALVSVSLALTLVLLGFGALGALLGYLAGMIVAPIGFARRELRGVSWRLVDKKRLSTLVSYSLPLTFAFALGFIINSSDRFLLGRFLGTRSVGSYAAGYDLTQQSLNLLLVIVNLAAFPLVVRALEHQGEGAARRQLRRNLSLLVAVGAPATAGMMVLAGNISTVFLGEGFRVAGTELIPWIALATLIAGVKSYYTDLGFQLGRRTRGQVWVALWAAIVNVIVNLWLIPRLGMMAAAYSTVLSFAIAGFLSWYLGRRAFRLPGPSVEISKVVVAVAVMTMLLWPIRGTVGPVALLAQIAVGVGSYGVMLVALDFEGARRMLRGMLECGEK